MKTYIEFPNALLIGTIYVQKDITNAMYASALKDAENKLAIIKPFNIPPTWEQIRAKRDSLLKDSDWSVAGDANPKPSKEAWLSYRQALRDLPQNFKTPEEVIWPEKPSN